MDRDREIDAWILTPILAASAGVMLYFGGFQEIKDWITSSEPIPIERKNTANIPDEREETSNSYADNLTHTGNATIIQDTTSQDNNTAYKKTTSISESIMPEVKPASYNMVQGTFQDIDLSFSQNSNTTYDLSQTDKGLEIYVTEGIENLVGIVKYEHEGNTHYSLSQIIDGSTSLDIPTGSDIIWSGVGTTSYEDGVDIKLYASSNAQPSVPDYFLASQ